MIRIDVERLDKEIKQISVKLDFKINSRAFWQKIDETVTEFVVKNYDSIVASLPLRNTTIKRKESQARRQVSLTTLNAIKKRVKQIYVSTFGKRTGTLYDDVLVRAANNRLTSGMGYARSLTHSNIQSEYRYSLNPSDFVEDYPAILNEIIVSKGAREGIMALPEEARNTIIRLFNLELQNQMNRR